MTEEGNQQFELVEKGQSRQKVTSARPVERPKRVRYASLVQCPVRGITAGDYRGVYGGLLMVYGWSDESGDADCKGLVSRLGGGDALCLRTTSKV